MRFPEFCDCRFRFFVRCFIIKFHTQRCSKGTILTGNFIDLI